MRDPLYQAAAAEVEASRFWAKLGRVKKRLKLALEVAGLVGGILYKLVSLMHARDVGRPADQIGGSGRMAADRVERSPDGGK